MLFPALLECISFIPVDLFLYTEVQLINGYCYMFRGTAFWPNNCTFPGSYAKNVLVVCICCSSFIHWVDVKQVRKPVVLLQWMGMNALIIYALAACEIFSGVLQGFYLGSPENNLVDGTESFLQDVLHSKHWGILAFVLLEILFWGFIAGLLHMKRIYVKL